MTILNVETIYSDENATYVCAVVEDAIQTYAQTHYDPAEYGSALCEASFILSDDEILPENEKELIEFLEGLDLDWKLVDNSDYYLD
jgi:hypothetical protein